MPNTEELQSIRRWQVISSICAAVAFGLILIFFMVSVSQREAITEEIRINRQINNDTLQTVKELCGK